MSLFRVGLAVAVGLSVGSTIAIAQTQPPVAPLPDEISVSVPVGEAPLYAAITSYTRHMSFLQSQGRLMELEREAKFLEVSFETYEALLQVLQTYRTQEVQDWSQRQLELCRPVLLAGDISNEAAAQALMTLDNDTERRNVIAGGVLDQVGRELGSDVKEKIASHLERYRAALSFSRTDVLKFIELQTDTDYRGFLLQQCRSL